ncbi:MFS transporter [Nocardiopsis oceani]
MGGLLRPLQVLLPEQVEHVSPADKETVLAWVTGVGAAMAMIATPLAGGLSDRTTGPLGRRRPWVLAGPIVVHLGGYAVLYTVCGLVSLCGAVVVWKIRGDS